MRSPGMGMHRMLVCMVCSDYCGISIITTSAGAIISFLTDVTSGHMIRSCGRRGPTYTRLILVLWTPWCLHSILPDLNASHMASTFSKKPVFGPLGMIYAMLSIEVRIRCKTPYLREWTWIAAYHCSNHDDCGSNRNQDQLVGNHVGRIPGVQDANVMDFRFISYSP